MRNRELTSASPVSDVLKEGYHIVHLISAVDCDSFSEIKTETIDGKRQLIVSGKKNKSFPWASPTLEIGIHIGNDQGTIVTRLRDMVQSAWKKPKNYPDLCNNPEYTEQKGYLLTMVNGKLDRVEDQNGIEKCQRMLKTFAFAITDGQPNVLVNDAIDQAIAKKTEFVIKIVKDPYVDQETGDVTNGYSVSEYWAKSMYDAKDKKITKSDIPADIQA